MTSVPHLVTVEELRSELQRFTEASLRQELATLRLQLQQDIQTELRDFQGKRKHLPIGRTLPPLSVTEDAPEVKPPGANNAFWGDRSRPLSPQARSASVHPLLTDAARNEKHEDEDSCGGVKNIGGQTTIEAPPLVSKPSDSVDEGFRPGGELRATADCGHTSESITALGWRPTLHTVVDGTESSFGSFNRNSSLASSVCRQDRVSNGEGTASDCVLFKAEGNSVKLADGDEQLQGPRIFRNGARLDLEDLEELETNFQMQQSIMRRRRTTKMKLKGVVHAQEGSVLARFCDMLGDFLEQGVMFVIVLNGIFIGVQTDYQSRNVTESVPAIFSTMEITFCFIFTAELVAKLVVHRIKFFFIRGWQWNVFDMFLVVLQLIEVLGMFIANHESESGKPGNSPVGNISFLRLLRILRLMRILRLVRLLHFVGELACIISSIANCFRALTGTVFLLLMMIYIVGIFFSQIVFSHRVMLEEDSPDLALWWGTLIRSTLTLYQAILGGVDWETVSTPLEEISPFCSIIFCFYIAFSLLGMMNIITGSFVQSALKHSENEKTKDFRTAARNAFMSDGQRTINFDDFVDKIEGESLKDWMKDMNIEIQDARLLYRLLSENTEDVSAERLVASMISLREGAKFIDIMKLMYELKYHNSKVDEWWESLRSDLSIKPDCSIKESRVKKTMMVPLDSMTSNHALLE